MGTIAENFPSHVSCRNRPGLKAEMMNLQVTLTLVLTVFGKFSYQVPCLVNILSW